jgi:transposase
VYQLISLPGCIIEGLETAEETLLVTARTAHTSVVCPGCEQQSHRIHSHYVRTPEDLPLSGKRARLRLRVRRFRCLNASCAKQTFTEPLPNLLPFRARRTARLARAQSFVGAALGGEAGARLLHQLSMPVSPATILRTLRAQETASFATPRILGVDDWAMRKGRTYGTILVDLEKRRAIDLLEDRSAATLAAWLQEHPGIEVVARDRSTEYAKGVSEGAPNAQQVADRWHLLLNVRQMVERLLSRIHSRLRRLPTSPSSTKDMAGNIAPTKRQGAFRRTKTEEERSRESRQQCVQRYQQVKASYESGASISAIARDLGLNRTTVRKYAYAQAFPERNARTPKPSILDPHLDYLAARHAEGCENASLLWREIQERGFLGSRRQVAKWMREERTMPAPTTPGHHLAVLQAEKAGPAEGAENLTVPRLPSARQLAWLIVQKPSRLRDEDKETLARVLQDAEVAHVHELSRTFVDMVQQKKASLLEAWLDASATSDVAAVRTFAAGIKQDYAAVRAALETPWSNGQTEGQVTKLKLIKRAMYGRANFDLLRQRVLLAA